MSEPYALVVANVTPNKDVHTLVRAARRLADYGEPMRIVLIGRDPAGLLEEALYSHGRDLVHRIEWADDNELRSWYAHAFCYVNTSLTEGFCLPILEAQTFGVPVICCDIPVLREVAGLGASFFSPQSDAELASGILKLRQDATYRARLSSLAQENAGKFSWGQAAASMVDIFQRVARGH